MEPGCALYQRVARTTTASQMNQAALSDSVAAAGLRGTVLCLALMHVHPIRTLGIEQPWLLRNWLLLLIF